MDKTVRIYMAYCNIKYLDSEWGLSELFQVGSSNEKVMGNDVELELFVIDIHQI